MKLIPIIVNHWALQASLITRIINIKQDQLNYYCYTELLPTSWPLRPAGPPLLEESQQRGDSGRFFPFFSNDQYI